MPDDPTASGAESLDLRGLKCPLPVLHTRRALQRLAPGRVIVVRCTDPLAGLDIPHLLQKTGDALLDAARDGEEQRFTIRKAGGDPAPQDPMPGARVDRGAKQPGAAPVKTIAYALLILALGAPTAAVAQQNRGSAEDQMACTPDVYRLCAGNIPDEDAITACLRQHKAQLSAGCKAVFSRPDTAAAPKKDDDDD